MREEHPNIKNALLLASTGWKLFPAVRRNGDHRPLIKWGEGCSSDPDTIQTWAAKWPECYFCVATKQSNITILDVDNKNDKKGSDELFKLELKHGQLPKTLTVRTPSGGFHYYFTGASAISTDKIAKGIDTPVMAPIPGSDIKGKGAYQPAVKAPPLSLPEWVRDKAGESVEKKSDRHEVYIELDQPINIEKAKSYLNKEAPIAVEGDSGDHTTYVVSCKVRDWGISELLCLNMMLDHWNERCEPPWGIEELQKKVNNAYNHAQDPIGKNTAAMDFKDSPPHSAVEGAPSSDIDTPIRLSELEGAPPPRLWVVEGLIPKKEVSILYGDGSLGKSLLAKQFGLSISSKGKIINYPVLCQMPVLYVTCEDDKDEVHRRTHNILKSPEYEFMDFNSPFWVAPRRGKQSILAYQEGSILRKGAFHDVLCNMISYIGEEAFVIIDTASDIFAVNENDRNAASFCVKTILGGLIRRYGCTILIVAHPSKSSIKNGVYDAGSTGWRNSVRSMLVLTPHEQETLKDHRWLIQTKSNYSAKIEPIQLMWEKGRFKNVSDEAIVDDIMDANVEIFIDLVRSQCEKGKPLGVHHSSRPNVYKIDIKDTVGSLMSKEVKEKIINLLIQDEIIEERKGQPRGNGLWLVDVKSEGEGR